MTFNPASEGSAYKRPPRVPYKLLPGTTLEISTNVIEQTLNAVASYRQRQLEACCFWYGRRLTGNRSRVQAVVIPFQRNSQGNYSVPSEAMARVSDLTRPQGLVNLAQVHTHPGKSVEHSIYDEEMANSRKALSIVLPFYGRPNLKWPDDIGIHEFQEDYWYKLNHTQSTARVALIDNYGPIMLIDGRR